MNFTDSLNMSPDSPTTCQKFAATWPPLRWPELVFAVPYITARSPGPRRLDDAELALPRDDTQRRLPRVRPRVTGTNSAAASVLLRWTA